MESVPKTYIEGLKIDADMKQLTITVKTNVPDGSGTRVSTQNDEFQTKNGEFVPKTDEFSRYRDRQGRHVSNKNRPPFQIVTGLSNVLRDCLRETVPPPGRPLLLVPRVAKCVFRLIFTVFATVLRLIWVHF